MLIRLRYIFFFMFLLRHLASALQSIGGGINAAFSGSNRNTHNAIQKMYDSLSRVSPTPPFDPTLCGELQACIAAMETVTLEDLGINEKALARLKDSLCMTITANPCFDIAVFILPTGKSIPLHDHPHMTVISKLIRGKLAVKSFTPMASTIGRDVNKYILTQDEVKSATDPTWYLTADRGNIHEFRSEDTCVVLDVLMPPYDDGELRPCNYYTETPTTAINTGGGMSTENLWELQRVPEPRILPYGVAYPGIRPIPTFK